METQDDAAEQVENTQDTPDKGKTHPEEVAGTAAPHKLAIAAAIVIVVVSWTSCALRDGLLGAQTLQGLASLALIAVAAYVQLAAFFAAGGALKVLIDMGCTRISAACAAVYIGAACTSAYMFIHAISSQQALWMAFGEQRDPIITFASVVLIGLFVVLLVGTTISWRAGRCPFGTRTACIVARDFFAGFGSKPVHEIAQTIKGHEQAAVSGLEW